MYKLGLCISQTTNFHSKLASASMAVYNDKTKNKETLRKNVTQE
jgi:hypothetical protein